MPTTIPAIAPGPKCVLLVEEGSSIDGREEGVVDEEGTVES